MYDLLAKMYREGKIDEASLDQAVGFGWITEAQKAEIVDTGGDTGVLIADPGQSA